MDIIEAVWWVSFLVLTTYHLFVFRIKTAAVSHSDSITLPGVSIVISVKNGSQPLLKNLDRLCDQHYPTFEVIIVDDHSCSEERFILEKGVLGNEKVRLIHSERKPGKKQALTLGIQEAKHDLILCTDADCFPTGPNWIQQMVTHSNGNMVLGYSPYEKRSGFLNRLIRFETLMTGMQYLSWAMRGRPYMGIGRNILYPKALFQKENPYAEQQHIPYGDDDLWVQKAAGVTKIRVCYNRAAHIFSEPATSWAAWFQQKHRHLSAGHHYSPKSWWQPAGYGIALILHWMLIIPLIFTGAYAWVGLFFISGLLLRWWTNLLWTKRLGDEDTNYWFPILELVYAVYLAGMGLYALMNKKKKWN